MVAVSRGDVGTRPRPIPAIRSIPRIRLHRVLADPHTPGPILIQAPAGYGKTTLLDEWVQLEPRPVARIRVTADLEEPGRFLRELWVTLSRLGVPGLDPTTCSFGSGAMGDLVQRTVAAVTAAPAAFVLVVDDAHRAHPVVARTLLEALTRSMPAGSQLIICGRPHGPRPWHRFDGSGPRTVITGRELAFNDAEARALVSAHGVVASDEAVARLLARTEGWPALLYLAASAVARADDVDAAIAALRGTDRLLAAYLDDAVLTDLDPRVRRFLEDTSLVNLLTGPLCDAMIGAEHCGTLLESLVTAGWSFVVPLDHERRAYRYHPMLMELLREQLEARDPARRAELCRRASRWCEQRGRIDEAIELSARAGDGVRAGDLALPVLLDRLATGRAARLRANLRMLGTAEVERTPALGLVACWTQFAAGNVEATHRWLAITFAAMATSPERCSPYTIHAARCTRALAGSGGVEQVLRDASSVEPLGPGLNQWWILASTLQGNAHLMMGDREEAREVLREAEQIAGANVLLHAAALGNLAMLALTDDDWTEARALAAQAEEELAHHRVHDVTILVHAVSALTLAHDGQARAALPRIGLAVQLIDRLAWAAPRHRIAAAVLCGEASILVGDTERADAMLTIAEELLPREPKALLLHDLCRTLRSKLHPDEAPPVVDISLTPAELRVLHHLPTHRSLREIGEQLYVSPHTIKSQTVAVYRKLGVRSRSEAVETARALNLLPDDTAVLPRAVPERTGTLGRDVPLLARADRPGLPAAPRLPDAVAPVHPVERG